MAKKRGASVSILTGYLIAKGLYYAFIWWWLAPIKYLLRRLFKRKKVKTPTAINLERPEVSPAPSEPQNRPVGRQRWVYQQIYKSKPLNQYAHFVAIDTETTGLSENDVVVEIGLAKYEHFKLVDTFTTLVNPCRPIPPTATQIHGITDDMVIGKPAFAEVEDAILDFIDGFPILGHNLAFDLRMLEQSGLNYSFENHRLFDTLGLARKHAGTPDNKLETLCSYYGIEREAAHRALSDCTATAALFMRLVEQVTAKKISRYRP